MFAVPGWSVSPGVLKTQALGSSTPPKAGINVANSEKTTMRAQRKRKRSSGLSKASKVNSITLADLWETVIEKKTERKDMNDMMVRKDRELQLPHKASNRPNTGLPEATWSKNETEEQELPGLKRSKPSKAKRRERKAKLSTTEDAGPAIVQSRVIEQPPKPATKLTPLQSSMKQKLVSARFRYLNQTLYTTPSSHSLELFDQNPEMFQEYHQGFRRQVEAWPENPADGYIEQIRQRAKRQGQMRSKNENYSASEQERGGPVVTPLPRTDGICHVADLGCGDAGISKALEKEKKNFKIQISSFDLFKTSPLVTKADIANLPLKDGSVDVAIFCLALMGTNWVDFVEEAFRVLRWKGELWIAEIKSRFGRVSGKSNRVDHSVGNKKRPVENTVKKGLKDTNDADLLVEVDGHEGSKDQTNVSAFVEVLQKRGFVLQSNQAGVDLSNKMFVRMNFVKVQTPMKGKGVPVPRGMAELGLETWNKKPKAKFIEQDVNSSTPVSSESSVLKPCVYKLR